MDNKIIELMKRLVAIQSDTGSALENNVAEEIMSIISENEYFQNNPQNYGAYVGDDFLKRPVIWALRKGCCKKTVILTGHYDCVEIDCYGVLKDVALNPDKLNEKLKLMELPKLVKDNLNSGNWIFGRGVNDMKSGLAIELEKLFHEYDANVLFLAVPDEENLSIGMRNASKLLVEIRDRFDLEYKLLVLTEPHLGEKTREYTIYTGTVGKIMPAIVVKGQISHASEVMSGLNSAYIMSEIINDIELNNELTSKYREISTQPPTCLYCRDLKGMYDVSLPEYTGAYFNYQFLNDVTLDDILENLRKICIKAIYRSLEKYKKTFDLILSDKMISKDKRKKFEGKVYGFSEIEEIAISKNDNYNEIKKKLNQEINMKVNSGEISIQEASIRMIKRIIELADVDEIIAVIGFIPPYYPPVDSRIEVEKFVQVIEKELNEKYKLSMNVKSYFMGICDISYSKCENYKLEEKMMENMIVDKSLYKIDFKEISELNIPSIVVGPLGQDYHTMYERVYADELVDVVPGLIDKLIYEVGSN